MMATFVLEKHFALFRHQVEENTCYSFLCDGVILIGSSKARKTLFVFC